MVVCKCRKATKLYCFVHKVPVCGECICFPEHQNCVVRTYSEWVIDGEYDQPKCCQCQVTFDEGAGHQVTRLGCLHAIHTSCLVSLIKRFPPHTAPAGYVCPSCSTPLRFRRNSDQAGLVTPNEAESELCLGVSLAASLQSKISQSGFGVYGGLELGKESKFEYMESYVKVDRFMDVRFRFGGVAGGVNPPGFTTQIHEDGFTIMVPFGYQMVVDMLHPPVIEVHNNNARGEGPVNEVNAAQPNFTDKSKSYRPLRIGLFYQNEVLHLLRNDTLPVRVALEQIPSAGLFMYTMELSNRRDGHRYNGHHFYSVEQLGNGEEDLVNYYRRSFVVDRHDGRVVTSRRYFMQNGNPDKFLIHYMIGDGPSDDNFPQIPV